MSNDNPTLQDIKNNFSYYFSMKGIKKWVVIYFILIAVVLGASIWAHSQNGFMFNRLPHILLFWLIGSVIFGLGWLSFANYYVFFRRAIIVSGHVSSYKFDPNTSTYEEEISYEIDGKVYKANNTSRSPRRPYIGTTRNVAIDPDDFNRVLIRMPIWPLLLFASAGVAVWGYFLFLQEF